MSLDVYLYSHDVQAQQNSGIFIREEGQTKEISREQWDQRFPGREPLIAKLEREPRYCYQANITHNLSEMAAQAGLYEPLWRPNENGYIYARDLVMPLEQGLACLQDAPSHFVQWNPKNGWGTYEGLVSFVQEYLHACRTYPDADIAVWR